MEEVLGCEAYLLFYQSLDSLLLLPHAPPTGAPAAVDAGLLGLWAMGGVEEGGGTEWSG